MDKIIDFIVLDVQVLLDIEEHLTEHCVSQYSWLKLLSLNWRTHVPNPERHFILSDPQEHA